MKKNKFLITQSLLSSYAWAFKKEDGYNDFINALKRKRTPPSMPMLNGIQFENMVTAYCEGASPDPKHKWIKGIQGVGDIVKDGAFQVKLSRNIVIDEIEFVLYGILDALKCGTIYDIKFSQTYKHGKYFDSPQHPMYFKLCPEAKRFTYLISNGKDVFKETYYPDDIVPIEKEISEFMAFVDERNIVDLYTENWKSKY